MDFVGLEGRVDAVMSISVEALNEAGLKWAQALVTEFHYLHRPVDPRCSPFAYRIHLAPATAANLSDTSLIPNSEPLQARAHERGATVGCLIFGRPEATRCGEFYGSVEDVRAGKCEVTRWEIINLARVFILPEFQPGGAHYGCPGMPGFVDRMGEWRSALAGAAIGVSLTQIVLDYLLARPPCFPEEPWALRYCISYQDSNVHRGWLYKASGFDRYRENKRGIVTWRKKLRHLEGKECDQVLEASRRSPRSRRFRAMRGVQQFSFV